MRASALLAALPVVLSGSAALAVTVSKIRLVDDDRILTDTAIRTYVNAARCSCDASLRIQFDVTTSGEDGSLVVAHGKRCVDSDSRLSSACDILERINLSGLRTVDLEVSISDIADCSGDTSTDALIVLADPTDEDIWQELTSLELPTDTEGPPPPADPKVVGGEELAEVAFAKAKDSDSTDKIKYQVLCEKDGAPVLDRPPDAAFTSPRDLCGAGEALVSESFVCAEASGATDSVTVLGLENGVTYHFYVVAIDAFGNPSDPADAGEATPAPELDLWEVYKKNGGTADGGHCFVATAAYGDYDDPQVVVLRGFRDRVLAQSEIGRDLIAFYYHHSPPLAAWIAGSDARRAAARLLLWPITFIADEVTP